MLTGRGENFAAEAACGLARDVIREFGAIRLRVFGTSMVPSILPGDLVDVRRARPSDISLGEVVLFMQEGRFFVHRVVGRKVSTAASGLADEPFLITRGDRQLQDDPPVSSSELLGRVVTVERQDRAIPLASHAPNRAFAHILRASDRATSLYLRLAKYSQSLSQGRVR